MFVLCLCSRARICLCEKVLCSCVCVCVCCLCVAASLRCLASERGRGLTGFHAACADRITAMHAFRRMVAAAVQVFYRFHVVIICCRRGRRRSVTVGRAVAKVTSARLLCPPY